MKNYFIFLSITSCAIAIVFSNCNKETCLGKKHYYYISQTMKDYFGVYLQEGRKWVYENNSKTKEIILEIASINKNTFFKERCNFREEYGIFFKNKSVIWGDEKVTFAKSDYSKQSDDVVYSSDFEIYYSNKSANFIDCQLIDSLKVSNNQYYNIIKRQTKKQNTYYFCKNYGLIKFESNIDTFNLK